MGVALILCALATMIVFPGRWVPWSAPIGLDPVVALRARVDGIRVAAGMLPISVLVMDKDLRVKEALGAGAMVPVGGSAHDLPADVFDLCLRAQSGEAKVTRYISGTAPFHTYVCSSVMAGEDLVLWTIDLSAIQSVKGDEDLRAIISRLRRQP
jgi:hypothetical protein